MANHNYSKYSNNKKNNNAEIKEPVETPVEVVAPEVSMEADPAPAPKAPEVVEAVENQKVPQVVEGTVVNCAKLNVRVTPSLNADVVTIINAGEKVTIDVAKSNRDWFSVRIDNGNAGYNGYCMKKYVTAKL